MRLACWTHTVSSVPIRYYEYTCAVLSTTGERVERVVALDSFRFSLTDTNDAESTNSGTVSITILSGLEAVSLYNTVNEEEPTVL